MLFESIPNELMLLIVLQCAYQQAARLSCTNSNIRHIVWPEAERMRTDHRVRLMQAARAIEATASCGATLNLVHCSVRSKEMTALAEALRGNRVLTNLNLRGNDIGPKGGVAIGESLAVNGVLTSLNLSDNSLCGVKRGRGNYDASGIQALAEALKVNGVLTELRLGVNKIGDEGAKALASALRVNGVLKELDLSYNGIGPTGATALADTLKVNRVLIALDLSDDQLCGLDRSGRGTYSPAGITALAEALKVNGVLTNLNLVYNSIGPTGATALADALKVNGVLTELDVGFNCLTEEAALGIVRVERQRNKLTWLGLAHCGIGPTGAAEIAEYVSGSGVLTSLDVSFNRLTEEAALGIVRVERERNKLTSLGLAGCSIGPTGAAEIADYVSGSGVLTTLDISENDFGDEGWKAICDAAVSGREGFELVM